MITLKSCDLSCLAIALPDEVEKYKAQGNFAAAAAAIERWLQKPVGAKMKERLCVEREILRQLPGQFPYTQEQAIALLREQAPDFGAADLRRLDEDGLAEWIFVDGEKHYIHNIVRNVMRKDPEIRRRSGMETGESHEKQMLKEELSWMRTHGESRWRFRLRASVKLKDSLFKPGMRLRAHLPLPAEWHQISDVKILSHSDCAAVIDPPDAPYRAICLEDAPDENREFFVEYEYTVNAVYRDLWAAPEKEAAGRAEKICAAGETDAAEAETAGAEEAAAALPGAEGFALPDFREFLKEQPPHICFTPYLRALAAEITAGARTPLAAAARIYDYVTKNVKYSFMRSYFLIPGIPEYCARNLRGDCGVQALLFITLCRICGIPAGWQSGFHVIPEKLPLPLHRDEAKSGSPVPGVPAPDDTRRAPAETFSGTCESVLREAASGSKAAAAEAFPACEGGSHDWAVFWIREYGWLYADPSFGGSAFADGDEERRRFYFGNLDPFRMAANHAFMQPFASPKRFLADDPCDNQSGELESDDCGYETSELECRRTLLNAEILPPA